MCGTVLTLAALAVVGSRAGRACAHEGLQRTSQSLLRPDAPAHRVVVRRGDLQRPAGAGHVLSPRARREGEAPGRLRRAAQGAARFPRGLGPLRVPRRAAAHVRPERSAVQAPAGPGGHQFRQRRGESHEGVLQARFRNDPARRQHQGRPGAGRPGAQAHDLGPVHQDRRQLQRAGQVHDAGRLRVVVAAEHVQPAPERDLPVEQEPAGAVLVFRLAAARGTLEVDGRAACEGNAVARDSAQRQPEQRRNVRSHGFRRQADHARVRRDTRAKRAADGNRADQGTVGDQSRGGPERRVRGLRAVDQAGCRAGHGQGRGDQLRSQRLRATAWRSRSSIGVNPFKYGVVGGGDIHTSIVSHEEFAFTGEHNLKSSTPQARLLEGVPGEPSKIEQGSAGLVLRLGRGEHPRIDLRRHGTQGDLGHQRYAHRRAGVRRIRFRRRRSRATRNGRVSVTGTACRWAAT